MSDLVVAAVVLGVIYLACKRTDPTQVPTVAPPVPVPTAPWIRAGGVTIGGSYAVPPWSSVLAAPGAISPINLPNSETYPTGQPAPPAVLGGIASGAGPQGVPLGGPLSPGVSTGTGTSRIYGLSGSVVSARRVS